MTDLLNILRRLTPLGRLAAGAGLLLGLLLVVTVLRGCGSEAPTSPDLSKPASSGGYSFPFESEAEQADFRAKSKAATNQCTFSAERYPVMRGLALNFDVLIPPDASRSPYSFVDVQSDMEYVPAYFVTPTATGMRDALEWAQSPGEVADTMPDCMQSTGALMLLGFQRGQRPINQNLLHIDGIIWFNSLAVRPPETQNSTSAELFDVPVIAVGAAEPVPYSRVADPPQDTVRLNTVVRRGSAVLRVARMEFTETESRLWLELVGRGPRSPGSYEAEQVRLRQNGAQTQQASAAHLGDVGALLEENPALGDLLAEDPIPPAGAGSLSGYLVFPPVDRTKTLFLSLPQPGGVGAPLSITIPSSRLKS